VVLVEYDPEKVSLEKLLEAFFSSHDPTSLNRQGNDVGTQYRSIILYGSGSQRNAITGYMEGVRRKFQKPIVTEVKRLDKFYPAEQFHQRYFQKHPNEPYSRLVIAPKVEKAGKMQATA
jgi:peptide-methionine (S)-S-oxide reductase